MSDQRRGAAPPEVSVVIATYNRGASVVRLLEQLAGQTLAAGRFEVIVVDDGSATPVAPQLAGLTTPYRLVVIAQENAGPAAARHRGILDARGDVVVTLDDDMRIGPDFLAEHLAAHAGGGSRVVLGRLRPEPGSPLRLFERYQLAQLDRLAADVAAGRATLRGSHLYTGNLSLRRADYLAVGGFDPAFRLSEDAELGIRLELAGATFAFSETAGALHASDHTSLAAWMRRGVAYGESDARIAEKHAAHAVQAAAEPWRFLFLVNPLSRPFLLASVELPALMRPVSYLVMWLALALAAIGLERAALAGTTLTYGIRYFLGVRAYAGSRRRALDGLRRYLTHARAEELGPVGRMAKCMADIRADHDALRRSDARYNGASRRGGLIADAVQRIGFQMMVAYRLMRLLRALRLGLLAKLASRAMRFFYAADIHWDAELAPGVVIVHGTGLVIGHAARVGAGCILFQHVTLGESIHPETREVGAPLLEGDVHVGPGAVLLGPIVIGRGTKITANALLMHSVPRHSLVEVAAPTVRTRAATGGVRAPVAAPPHHAGADGECPPVAAVATGEAVADR